MTHIKFYKLSPCPLDGKIIYNKKEQYIGKIVYDKEWKCFTFIPDNGTTWSTDCLEEIQNEITELEKITRGK